MLPRFRQISKYLFILFLSLNISVPIQTLQVIAPQSSVQETLDELLQRWVKKKGLLPGEFYGARIPRPIGIGGVGAAYPSRRLTNADLVGEVDRVVARIADELANTDKPLREDKLFSERQVRSFDQLGTGIKSRYWFDPEQDNTALLATKALIIALREAGFPPEKITEDLLPWLISVATYPPTELKSPGLGPLVKRYLTNLGFPFPAFCGDAVCPGWIAAVANLVGQMTLGWSHVGLIPVLEWYSKYLRPDSRSSWPIFGDMAAASVLAPAKKGYGILWGIYQTEGRSLFLPDQVNGKPLGNMDLSRIIHTPERGYFTMHGQAVGVMAFKTGTFVVKRMETIIKRERIADGLNDVKWFVFHQANKGLVQKLADSLGIPRSKLLFTVEEFGNTSAASIPLTLYEHRDKLKEGDLVFMGTFGGGFQWGALLARWGGTLSLETHTLSQLTQLTPPAEVEQAI